MAEETVLFLHPTKRTTMLDFATEALRNAILNGEVGLGERINETTFTAKLEISRSTFREALRQLEQAGLLVRVPFRGTFVRDFNKDEIKNLNDLRAALEAYAVEIIIESGKNRAEDLLPLHQIVSEMEGIDAEKETAQTNILHITFHRTLLNMAGNKLLFGVWNDLSQQFWVAMRVSQLSIFAQGEADNFAEAHRELVNEIALGNADQFRKIIRKHVSHPSNIERNP